MTISMFENFQVPGLYICDKSTVPIYSSGVLQGVSVDFGEGNIVYSPIIDGYKLPHAIQIQSIGGETVIEKIVRTLRSTNILGFKDIHFNKLHEIAEFLVKEKVGKVFIEEKEQEETNMFKNNRVEEYILPDSTKIELTKEYYAAAEALFTPSLVGFSSAGIIDNLYYSIMKCDVDIRKSMYENVYLSGGPSLIKGMTERINFDLQNYAPASISKVIKVRRSSDPLNASWIGASVLSFLSTCKSNLLSKQEYEENGPKIIHKQFN